MIEVVIQLKQDGNAMDHLTNVQGPDESPATKDELLLATAITDLVRHIIENDCATHTSTAVTYDKPTKTGILPRSL